MASFANVLKPTKEKRMTRRNGPPCPSCGVVGVNPSQYKKGGFGGEGMPIVDRRICDNSDCDLKTYMSVRGENQAYRSIAELREAKGL